MSNSARRHSSVSSTNSNMNAKRKNTSILPSPLLTEVRSAGFSTRLSALIYADNDKSGILDSSRPRPYFNSSAMLNSTSTLTPPSATADFNRSTSCDRSFGIPSRLRGYSPKVKLPVLSPRNSTSLMSPRNRRSMIRNRSSPPSLSPFSRHTRSATNSPVVTVRVAPSQPFSPFRSTMQDPTGKTQPPSRHHGLPQTAGSGMNVSLPPGNKMSALPRANDMNSQSCVQQSESGDKIDPRRVLAVLQELSRSRKRSRERERGKRLMADCRDHGMHTAAGDDEEDDDDEDDDDDDEDEEEEEEETGSKRARRDSSSSLGSSLSMDMPPLFSHNGVVGQTTSHLVASDHLSLNSLLSQSQSVYGHKGSLQTPPSGNQSHIASSTATSSHVTGMQHNSSHHSRSRKQKTILNEVQASGTSSLRDRKRLRDDTSSDSDEEPEETKTLGKKKGISAPNIVSPSAKSPKSKKVKMMSPSDTKQESNIQSIPQQSGKKKTVAFAEDSRERNDQPEVTTQGDVSGPPKIVLPAISELIKNSPAPPQSTSEEESQKPLLSNPDDINQDRKINEKRVKAMIADAFDESESDDEKENSKEAKDADAVKIVSTVTEVSTSSTSSFKFGGETTKLPTISNSSLSSQENSVPVKPVIESKLGANPVESSESSKDKATPLSTTNTSIKDGFKFATKLQEVPSTLELISKIPPVTSSIASVTSSIPTLQPTKIQSVTTTASEATSKISSVSGFNFSFTSTNSPTSTEIATKESTSAISTTQNTSNIPTFTFSAKPASAAPAATTILSSKSVLSALSNPTFQNVLSPPNKTVEDSKDTVKVSSPASIITTTSSSNSGFQFNLGKPGISSPLSSAGFSSAAQSFGQSTKPSTTTMPSGGFNFSSTPTTSFKFGSDKPPSTIGLTTTTPSITSPALSTSSSAIVAPVVPSNMFSFGAKNPPDVTSTKPSLSGASFSFGNTNVVSPVTTTTTTAASNTGLFNFGATTSAPSTASSTLTGTKPFSFESPSVSTSTQAVPSLFSFGQKSSVDNAPAKQAPSSTFAFGGKTDPTPAANTSSLFSFGKTAPTQDAPKGDSSFSFGATSSKSSNSASTLVPQTTPSAVFSFGGAENKSKESNIFAFGNSSSTTTQSSGGIFSFGGASTTAQSQGSTGVQKQPDATPAAPFQFSGSASLQSNAPQKTFSFGQTGSQSSSEAFKFSGATSGGSNASSSQLPSFGAAKASTFGASAAPTFGAASNTPKPGSAAPSIFQFGQSSNTNINNPQPSGSSNSGSGIFSFGGGSSTSTATPFGAASQTPAPAFGATSPPSNSAGSSQSSTGFNFAASASTAVPGVFQFGGAPSNQQTPAPASSFSFGGALANAPSFGATSPSMGQPTAPQGGNMFSIGSSGNTTNKPGRTIRTATRRRPK